MHSSFTPYPLALVPTPSPVAYPIANTRSPRDIEVTFDPANGSETWHAASALEMNIPTGLGLAHLWEFGHLAVVAKDDTGETIPLRLRVKPAAWEIHSQMVPADVETA